jgi:F0F1-type ATP synthase assembly protein I
MLGVTVAAGAYAGRFLDRRWDTSPWLTLVGAFVGLIASVFEMLAVMKQADGAPADTSRKP